MAGELAAVLAGLETRLETISGLRVEPEELTNGPAIVLEPATHDPHATFSNNATYYIDLVITVPFGVPREARALLISYLEVSGTKSVQATLEADRTLGGGRADASGAGLYRLGAHGYRPRRCDARSLPGAGAGRDSGGVQLGGSMATEGKVYRQLARTLRLQRAGETSLRITARPVDANKEPIDTDEAPTLVTVYDDDVTSAADLLRSGAIEEYKPHTKREKAAVETALADAGIDPVEPVKVVRVEKDKPKDGG